MRDIVKPGAVLLIVCVVAAICLGFVYDITKKPIEEQEKKVKADSMKEIYADADEFKIEVEPPADNKIILEINTAYLKGEKLGYIFMVAPKGYAGEIKFLTGVNTDGTVKGISIVTQKETPGLGTKALLPEFKDQYKGKTAGIKVIKASEPKDNEVVAITSATITTKAVTLGVNEALDYFEKNLK